ncbi:MAG: tetratricopeptide repeat protein [Bryobacteraceae bacterium]
MSSADSLVQQGVELQKAGDLRAAADVYRKILASEPEHPEALYLLGCLAHQSGNPGAAVDLLRRAARLRPDQAECHGALAVALYSIGSEDEAEACFRAALVLDGRPDYFAGLAAVLKKKGDEDAAIAVLERGIGPSLAQANNLAMLRRMLLSRNRNVEASAHLGQVAALLPKETAARCEFADLLLSAGDAAGALMIYRGVLADDSNMARAWYSAGSAQEAMVEFADAAECFSKAVELRPDWLEARHNLGRALYELGQVEPAFDHFTWCGTQPNEGARHSRAMMAVIVPGVPRAGNQMVLDTRRNWATHDAPVATNPGKSVPHQPGKPLRIGYVSSFFHRDNWMKPVWGLMNRHDRHTVQIDLFSDAPREAIQHGYRAHDSDSFFDTSKMTNAAIADLVQAREVEVLIDLNGYSNMSRLPMFALRPAPVIVGWFNMYATTGMDAFDYLIGDHQVIPQDEEQFYSEKIVRVATSYLTFDVEYPVPPVAEPPCLQTGRITFGSLGSQYKITSEVVAAWSQILARVPNSILLLKNKHLGSESTRSFVLHLFARHGIANNRLGLEGPDEHYRYLQAYDRIDLALDTFPYNGGTTTTEAIWQGVPVLTFSGDRWASRTSASILRAAGLEDFVAGDVQSFIDLAVKFGAAFDTPTRLANLRRTMRMKLTNSEVCDTARFAREMEEIYLRVRKN